MRSDVTRKHLSLEDQKRIIFDRLCLAWEGGDWLPSDVLACNLSPSTAAMQCIDKATAMAQSQNKKLSFLWGPSGPLRIAFQSSGQTLSSDFCSMVNRMVDDWEDVSRSTMQRQQNLGIEAQRMLDQLSQIQSMSKMSTANVKDPSRSVVFDDRIPGLQIDLNYIKEQIDEACSRKLHDLLYIVILQFQLREHDGLFLGDAEGPTNDDRKMRDASLEPTQTTSTQSQADLIESEIRKATQEAKIAEADINKLESKLQAMTGTVREFVEAQRGI